jgi:hypothetical protein
VNHYVHSKLAKTGRPLAPTTAQTYGHEVWRICRYIGNVALADLGGPSRERDPLAVVRDSSLLRSAWVAGPRPNPG